MLTDEDKAQLEVPFVGKNGTTRKLEVLSIPYIFDDMIITICSTFWEDKN